jgi:signal peptidase
MNIVFTVILVLLIVTVILLFVMRLTGNVPSVFGYQVYRVSSGSMEPTLSKGDVILVKKVPMSDIKKNDIITYKSREGQMEGEMITHRVIEEPKVNNGSFFFQTKGDADGATLDPVVTDEQVQGMFVKKVPFIDKLYSFFFTPYGLIAFIFVIILLFGYEMVSLILSYRSIDIKDDDYYEPKPKKKRKKRK